MRRWHVRIRRAGIVLLGLIALLLVMAVVGIRVLDHARVRRALADSLAARLSQVVKRGVQVGDVRVTAFPPHVAVCDLVVGDPAAPLLAVARAEVHLGEVRLAEREVVIDTVRVRGVRIATRAPQLAPGGEGSGGSWVHVVVRQLEVQDVQVERLEVPDTLSVTARDVEARLVGGHRTPIIAGVAHVGSFELRVPGIEPVSGSLRLWGRKGPTEWQLQRLRGSGAGWAVDASGSLGPGGPRARGEVDVDAAVLDRMLRIRADLKGQAHLSFDVGSLPDTGLGLDARVQSEELAVAGFVVRHVVGEAHLSAEGLDASLVEGHFADGAVSGTYALAGLRAPWSHRVALRGDHLGVAAFLEALGVPAAGLAGRVGASAEVAWDGQDIKGGSGTVVAEIQPVAGDVPVSGRLVLALNRDGAIHFAGKDLTLGGAAVRWEGPLTLGDWLPTWSVQADGVPVAVLRRLLQGWIGVEVVPAPLSGAVALAVRLQGPFDDISVEGDVALAPVAFGPVEADGVEASFRVGQGVVRLDKGLVVVGQGQTGVNGELRYSEGGRLDFQFAGKGIPLDRAIAWGGVHAPVGGEVRIEGRVTGSLEQPDVSARVGLDRVAVAGIPLGGGQGCVEVTGGTVSVGDLQVGPLAAHARIDLARRRAEVDATLGGFGLDAISPPLARLAGGALDCQLHGAFPFDEPAGRLDLTSAGGAHGVVSLDDRGLLVDLARPAVWSLSGGLRRQGSAFGGNLAFAVESFRTVGRDLADSELPLDGRLRGQAVVTVEPGKPVRIDGTIEDLEAAVEGEKGTLDGAAPFTIEGGAIHVGPVALTGQRSHLEASGSRSAHGALSGRVVGTTPAAIVGLFWKDARATGTARVDVAISGSDEEPRFAGSAHVDGGSLLLAFLPGPLTRLSGDVEFLPEGVRVASSRFDFLGGTATCSGRVAFEPDIDLDLGVQANHVRWPLVVGLTPVLSGPLRIVGPLANLSISGDLTLDRTVYRRALDLQKLVMENLFAPVRSRTSDAGAVGFNIAVAVPGTFEINTELARLSAKGELRVVGTTAQPGALGRLEALPGGEAELADVRYQLDRCVVTFTNPEAIEPMLDIQARTTVADVDVTVGLIGTLDRMVPTFTSSPPLPEMDIISLISTGRRADAASSASVGTVASTFLADQLTGAVTARARTLLAVDQLRVDPFAATESGEPAARLTVVKQLAKGWSVTLSTNLSSNREEVIESRYLVAPGFYLNLKRQEDGTYFAELTWQRRY